MEDTKNGLKKVVKEELDKIIEMDIFGTKKAEQAYDKAMSIRHKDLADIHNRLKEALGDPMRLQQVASAIVKELALQFRNMDR